MAHSAAVSNSTVPAMLVMYSASTSPGRRRSCCPARSAWPARPGATAAPAVPARKVRRSTGLERRALLGLAHDVILLILLVVARTVRPNRVKLAQSCGPGFTLGSAAHRLRADAATTGRSWTQSKKSRPLGTGSAGPARASSSTPMPGRSQTVDEAVLARSGPAARRRCRTTSRVGRSGTRRRCSCAAGSRETWTSAARPSRPLPVPCGAIRMPCRSAYSAIHFSSAMPPTSHGSGPTMSHGVLLDQVLEVLAQVDLLAGVDRRRWCARSPRGRRRR